MSDFPSVSILTPAWNATAFLAATAASVLAQDSTYKDWEWIIADDASTDGTDLVLHDLAANDSRIRFVRLAQNAGPARARQKALDLARGRYVAFLDADDLWLPGKLARQIDFMREKSAALCYTAMRRMSADGGKLYPRRRIPASLTWRQLLSNTAIVCSSVIIDRDMTGPFSMVDAPVEDFALWLSILRRGHVAVGFDEDLVRYRMMPRSRSSNHLDAAWRVWLTYRVVEKLPLAIALPCFARYALNTIGKRFVS